MRHLILEKTAKATGSSDTGKLFYDKEVLNGVQFESFMVLLSILGLASLFFILVAGVAAGETLNFLELVSFGLLEFLLGLMLIFYGVLSMLAIVFSREFFKKIETPEEYYEAIKEANASLFCICMMPVVGSYLFTLVRSRFQKWL